MSLVSAVTLGSIVLTIISIVVNLRASIQLPDPFSDVFRAVAATSVCLAAAYVIWLFLSEDQRVIWSGIMRGVSWVFLYIVYIRPALVALKHERFLRAEVRKNQADIERLREELGT